MCRIEEGDKMSNSAQDLTIWDTGLISIFFLHILKKKGGMNMQREIQYRLHPLSKK
jgi:hypothetical protein